MSKITTISNNQSRVCFSTNIGGGKRQHHIEISFYQFDEPQIISVRIVTDENTEKRKMRTINSLLSRSKDFRTACEDAVLEYIDECYGKLRDQFNYELVPNHLSAMEEAYGTYSENKL